MQVDCIHKMYVKVVASATKLCPITTGLQCDSYFLSLFHYEQNNKPHRKSVILSINMLMTVKVWRAYLVENCQSGKWSCTTLGNSSCKSSSSQQFARLNDITPLICVNDITPLTCRCSEMRIPPQIFLVNILTLTEHHAIWNSPHLTDSRPHSLRFKKLASLSYILEVHLVSLTLKNMPHRPRLKFNVKLEVEIKPNFNLECCEPCTQYSTMSNWKPACNSWLTLKFWL